MNQAKQANSETPPVSAGRPARILLWMSVISHLSLVVGIWGVLIAGSGGGLDLSDESFALMSYRHPEDVTATFSMFHVVLSPIYHMGGENLPFLRIFGMIILIGVTGISAALTVKALSRHTLFRPRLAQNAGRRVDQINLVLLALGGAALFYMDWRLTPTYDWMTLVGILLFWSGLLLWLDVERPARSMLGAGLIGFAGAFTFWGKATSAAVLPLFMLAALYLNRDQLRRLVAPKIIIAGLMAFLVGMSIPLLQGETASGMIEKLQQGIAYQRRLKAGEYQGFLYFLGVELVKLSALIYATGLSLLFSAPFWGGFLMLALASLQVTRRFQWTEQTQQRWVEGLLVIGWLVATRRLLTQVDWASVLFLSLLVLVIVFLWANASIFRYTAQTTKYSEKHSGMKTILRWIFPILALFITYMFGTGAFYIGHGGRAGHLVLMAAFIPLIYYATDSSRVLRSIITLSILAVTLFLVVDRSSVGFRQAASVWEMDYRVTIPERSQTLYVSQAMATYIEGLQTIAYSNGFKAGMPLIDMTGETPGAVYVLNARMYVFPWLIGGWLNSDEANRFLLSLWDTNLLRQAWLLTENLESPSHVSVDVLMAVGLRFPEDYEKVGEAPIGYQGGIQALWRPRLTPDEKGDSR